MIFIVVKFKTKPEWTDKWLDLVHDFTVATREEPGNLWFEWSQSADDPSTFVLVEAFQEDGAVPHVNSDHFKKAMSEMPQALAETPKIAEQTSLMEENISSYLKLDENSQINIKATTTDGLGFEGSKYGVSCQAICLLKERDSE